MKVTIIDYGLSNLLSVQHAFAHFGAETLLTSKPEDVLAADALVLPGVGAFQAWPGWKNWAWWSRSAKKPLPVRRCWASAWECRCCLTSRRSSACTKVWG